MRYLVFASLLALQIIFGSCGDPEIIILKVGQRLELAGSPVSGNYSCTLKIANEKYSVHPTNDAPGSYTGTDEYCEQTIQNVDASFAGLWTMTTKVDEEEIENQFIVQITQQDVPPIPSQEIIAYDGEWINFGLDLDGANVTSCSVFNSNGLTLNLMEEIEGVTLYGACGIRIPVNNSFNSVNYWGVRAQVGDYLLYESATIEVKYRSRIDNDFNAKKVESIWNIEGKGVVGIKEKAVFCQWTKPDGTKMPLSDNCTLEIPSASPYHQGTWRVSYAVDGMTSLQHRDVIVKTNDENLIECEYHFTPKSKEINILCKSGRNNLNFCSFKKPDGSRLNLPAGSGNSSYSYYGRGYTKVTGRNAECGVTIHSPSHDDFGLWTCKIGYTNKKESKEKMKIRGAVIDVVNTRAATSEHLPEVEYPPVFVKRGNSFKLNCKMNGVLDYCWMSSPNGTAHSVLEHGNSIFGLEYDGQGFAMGDCSMVVPRANITDSGDWLCHMGVVGGFEVERKIPVKVTESNMIAHKDMVLADDNTNLVCRSIVEQESSVQYCRWVRPNGQGINIADSHRYTLSQNTHNCSLKIMDIQSEDIGKWTCVALLTNSNSQEQRATVEVTSANNAEQSATTNVLAIVLGTGFLVIMVIGVGYAMLSVYRKRITAIEKNLPPYYPKDYPIPNGIQTSVDSMQNQKNYKY